MILYYNNKIKSLIFKMTLYINVTINDIKAHFNYTKYNKS